MWSEHIQPMLSKAVQAFGKFGECIGELWKNVIQPFVSWIIQTLAPVVGPLIKNLGSIVLDMIGHISDIFSEFWYSIVGRISTGKICADFQCDFNQNGCCQRCCEKQC